MLHEWLELLASERWNLAGATAAHLELVVEAVLLAVLAGVPLGILAARSKSVERAAIGVTSVLQTIPSLALLGFLLIAFRGQLGKAPALAALVLYSLLPIVKNTILGLRSIDAGVQEAALALGMTESQRLFLVELPLAVPIVLGGVRVATVAAVGMATIAATIGAQGLGSYIFRGVALSHTPLILMGSVPAALLALVCDAGLGAIERRLDPTRRQGPRRQGIALALCLAAILTGCGWIWWHERLPRGADRPTITIGSKDGSEMILLGHLLADLVEARTNFQVDRRFNLGGTLVCYNALRLGGLDSYVEYTGTALTTILKKPVQTDPKLVLDLVSEGVRTRDRVLCLDPFGFENTFALLMRREQAERFQIRTISDLRPHLRTIRAGFGPEFMNRPDGYPGLVRAYGLEFTISPREMDRNLLYQALAQGSLDLAAGDSTEGRVAALDLVQLADDRQYFPPYEAVPLVRGEVLERFPELRDALNGLAGKIDAATMRRLNYEIDGKHRRPEDVAREFLTSSGLLGP